MLAGVSTEYSEDYCRSRTPNEMLAFATELHPCNVLIVDDHRPNDPYLYLRKLRGRLDAQITPTHVPGCAMYLRIRPLLACPW
jgi:hypothetical protein